MTDKSIKENIRRRREELGITQGELALRLGMDRTSYRNLEIGGTRMINPHLEAIASQLDTTVAGLLFGNFAAAQDDFTTIDDVSATYRQKIADKDNEFADFKAKANNEKAVLLEQIEMLKGWLKAEKEINSYLRAGARGQAEE